MSRKSTAFLSFALMLFFSGVGAFAFAQERVPVGHHCAEDDQGNIVCSKHSGGTILARTRIDALPGIRRMLIGFLRRMGLLQVGPAHRCGPRTAEPVVG